MKLSFYESVVYRTGSLPVILTSIGDGGLYLKEMSQCTKEKELHMLSTF